MTELNENNYERVAAWLDGQAVELTAAEFALAQQIQQGEAELGGMLEASAPATSLAEARRTARQELARLGPVRVAGGLYVKVRSAVALAAAAVVIAAAGLWMWGTLMRQAGPTGPAAVRHAVAAMPGMNELTTDEQVILAGYAGRFDRLQTDLTMTEGAGPSAADTSATDPMSQALRQLWLEDVLLYGPTY